MTTGQRPLDDETFWTDSRIPRQIEGCSNSNLSKQDKGTFRGCPKLSSAGSAIILFLPLSPSHHGASLWQLWYRRLVVVTDYEGRSNQL